MNTPLRIVRLEETPEARLRRLFARRDAVLEQLAGVDFDLKLAARDFAAAHGLRVIPRLETIRATIGGRK